ncbi:PAS domain-containing protein [Hymenobacter sp. BT175]|uniref:PAS domain-containing protein n=1 Tax=Hymenobacter translucens TaxID=2886507 RepID=UPI001D0E4561|nr:PAS domain-containing protein [Hymenobacter translucens]MCC2546579.1 PAS domain-containing protein [Hymenobacter translucens]
MSQSAGTLSSLTADVLTAFPAEELAFGLLEASLTGVALYLPVYDPAGSGQIIDLTIELLNPAARRILNLDARPQKSYLTLFPHTLATGVFDFHCRTFESGQPGRFSVNYQADGLDNYFHLSARRVGAGLLVSFTDTADHDRTAVEVALRESQGQEKVARAEAEQQWARLERFFMQAPAMIAIFEGPGHVFRLVNSQYQRLVGNRPLLGKPIREAMPELEGQPIFDLLDEVYHTGKTYHANEMLVQLDHDNTHPRELEKRYYNFIYQPTHDGTGNVDGIFVFAYEVTTLVRARQQVEDAQLELQTLNMQLGSTNEELQAANEETRANIEELSLAQQSLQQLNRELEGRVEHRTHEAQQALAEAERQRARLERFFMQAPAAICILDGPDLVYELVNPQYQQLFPGRTLLGHPLEKVMPEFTSEPILGILRQVYQTGETYEGKEVKLRLPRQSDETPEDVYLNFVYQARFDEQGAIDGILVFAYDVTAQVLARRQIERSEQEFRTVTNAIPHMVWTATPDGNVDYYNEQWYHYTGSSPEQAQGRGWMQSYHPVDLPLVQEKWEQALQTGEPYLQEARLRRADGAYRWFMVRALSVRDEQGQVLKWFGTITDIHQQRGLAEALQLTSRKLATTNKDLRKAHDDVQTTNDELGQANEELTRMNQDLDNFVYTASHDLKQPVNNMAGVFEELKRTATFHDPEAARLVRMFEEALSQIHSTIQGLAEVVQAGRRTEQLRAESVALLPLTQGIIQSMHSQVAATRAEFELDFDAVPVVYFARLGLQSVLYNLLSNALKYAQPGRTPRVRVATQRDGQGEVVLLVQDNGLGLDMSRYGSELFQMFRRFHDHVNGSGLGLYLVNRIVQQAGGHIDVESTLGEGTTFRIHLPGRAG